MEAAIIADRQRKVTDIHQLLNPQNQSLSLHRGHHSQNPGQVHHGASVANHGHRAQQNHGDQLYPGQYQGSSSYNLAPVNWDKRSLQTSPMNVVNGVYGQQATSNQATNTGYMMGDWNQQHMFNGAVSGQYPPNNYNPEPMYRDHSTSSTSDAYHGQHQLGERASMRVVEKRSQQQRQASQPEYRNWGPEYPSHDVVNNNGYSTSTPSSSTYQPQDDESSATTSHYASQSRKRMTPPATDPEVQPKPKKSRKKSADETASRSSSASTNSKRGYTQKKRNETAQIVAQNATFMPTLPYAQLPSGKGKEKAAERMHIVSTNSGVPVAKLTPELQVGRCMAARYKAEEFPRCVSCTRRWAGDTCRFQGIRFFLRDAESRIVGVSFVNNQKAEKKSMEFPTSWNVPLTMENIRRTKSVTARALLPVLVNERKHVQATEIIYRPRESDVRATCDTCMTSLFCSSWMCRVCGREACSDCYEQLKELTGDIPNATPEDMQRQKMLKDRHAHSSPFFLTCTKRNEHRAAEFTPVSRFCLAELEEAISMMKDIISEEDSRDGGSTPELEGVGSGASSASGSSGVRTPTETTVLLPVGNHSHKQASGGYGHQQHLPPQISPARIYPPMGTGIRHGDSNGHHSYPHEYQDQHEIYENNNPNGRPDTTPFHPIRRFKDHELKYDVFQNVWRQGEPLLVEGLLSKFSIQWTPEYFIQTHGDQSCIIVECQTNMNRKVSVGEFFSWFGRHDSSVAENKEIWKLKDWPPSTDFKTTFPELYEDFSKAVPVPNYVRRDGTLNISSHFPTNAIAPDLGPKMYNAMGSSCDIGSMGSTRLHMDMADAVNIMTFSARTKEGYEGCAAWDLFRAEDSDKIRAFLKRKAKENGGGFAGQNAGSNQYMDPIHGQQVYLDEVLRKELWEQERVKSYRVYQRPGEAIFIPAGCAHQVCNLSDCIKVAIDFVSPENIVRCEKLTKEFREQNQGKAWKEDVLQLRTMMWFAWLSCCHEEEKRK
ncbi:hypothetical protein D9758_007482 [Tetrapyrgos nigripes]|uniref:JmjC domain-containing protein n=1 Tax=Tetrapyrgos nigripes TaxID=182062 RepID=A0A8H5G3M0_9AGAR|nr:hypothetical protein D9758_007482 [Tetrapyrgos nigripes]